MSSAKQPYFLTPAKSSLSYPLLVFLPGLDETGKELLDIQTAGLENAFDVRCFVIPPDQLRSWELLADQAIALTQAELEQTPRPSVYLCADSFGGCIALKVAIKAPQLFKRIVLVNPASSFQRVPWLDLGSLVFPLTPQLFYKIFSFLALPFLAPLHRLSPTARQALLKSVKSAPQSTASHRLTMMRQFSIDEMQLHQLTQPVLLIGSKQDRLLPSVAEVQRLARILPNTQVVTLPHSGHACLVEEGVNLYDIMQSQNFIDSLYGS